MNGGRGEGRLTKFLKAVSSSSHVPDIVSSIYGQRTRCSIQFSDWDARIGETQIRDVSISSGL